MSDEFKEKMLEKYPRPVSIEGTKTILNQMQDNICKIYREDGIKGTGFFCNISCNNNIIPVMMTNNHILDQKYIKENKEVQITLNNDKEDRIIKLNDNRMIYSNEEYDTTIIEIKPDIDKINKFMELDEKLFKKPNNLYNNHSIYILHYFYSDKVLVSYGILDKINEYNIIHHCCTESGSSGSPIINLLNHKIIGIHVGGSKLFESNKGTYLKYPIDDFINQYLNKKISINKNENINKSINKNYNNENTINNFKDNNNKKKLEKIEINDYLHFADNSNINQKIGDEKIVFTDKIQKIAFEKLFSKNQERNLLITNLAIYLFKEFEIKRRIKIENLKAITVSKISEQFIIHCNQNDYDYLFIYKARKTIIKTLQNIFEALTGKDLLFCQKNDKDLSKFVVGKKERTMNPYLFKIEQSELTSIKDYLYDDLNESN